MTSGRGFLDESLLVGEKLVRKHARTGITPEVVIYGRIVHAVLLQVEQLEERGRLQVLHEAARRQ